MGLLSFCPAVPDVQVWDTQIRRVFLAMARFDGRDNDLTDTTHSEPSRIRFIAARV